MTEIPEHLLKRSRERRQALSGGSGDSGASESSTPAPAEATAPAAAAAPAAPAGRAAAAAPATPAAPEPDSAVVAAAKARKKIPFWAMAALSLIPVWAFLYAKAMTTQPVEVVGPLGLGAAQYSVCAACHTADGGPGGIGYQFSQGEVVKTFPHIEDQIRFVALGTDAYRAANIEIYGDPNRDGGPHVTGVKGTMPAQAGTLTDAEILGVVCHERYDLGGADPTGDFADEFGLWCAEDSEIFTDLEAGGDLATLHDRFPEIVPIGDEPVPGLSADG